MRMRLGETGIGSATSARFASSSARSDWIAFGESLALKIWSALRGNFQRTAFRIPDEHWARITRVLARTNPGYERAVLRFGSPPRADSEKLIERWLSEHLNKLDGLGYRGVRLYRDPVTRRSGRQFPCPPNGRIDLLCEYGNPKRFLVIEVKKVRANLATLLQSLKYQTCVKDKLAGRRGVDVLVVSLGAHPDFTAASKGMSTVGQIDVGDLPRSPRFAA